MLYGYSRQEISNKIFLFSDNFVGNIGIRNYNSKDRVKQENPDHRKVNNLN